jgi:hypothetical protein
VPADFVVAQGIVNEVRHEQFDQPRVAGRGGGGERRLDAEVPAFGFGPAAGQGRVSDLSEIEPLPALDAAFAGGQGEEGINQLFLLVAELKGLFAGRPERCGGGAGIGQRDLQESPLPGQRGPQFVGSVGDESALSLERGFKPPEQMVQRAAELSELVIGAGQIESPVEVGRGNLLGGNGDRFEGPEDAPGEPPGPGQSDDGRSQADQRRPDVEVWLEPPGCGGAPAGASCALWP